jgi:hypothetical protein
MAINGVDISSYQSGWTPTNEEFVFVKASEGSSYVNPYHDAQVTRARAAKLVVGHYHWLHHGNAKTQAQYFVKHAKPKDGDILVCDYEQAGVTVADKNTFMQEVKRLCPDNRVILYCNISWWNASDKKAFDGLWIAYYGDKLPSSFKDDYLFWQWSQNKIDKNKSTFKTKAELKAWANLKPKVNPSPVPVVVSPSKPTVDGIELGPYKTSGTHIKFRPLYHNNNVKANSTCYCVTQAIAVAEARLKKLGVIKNCLDFWQFGYGKAAAASADTHAGGGVIDTVQTDAVTLKVLREVGFTAAWYRGPGARYGNFSTPHIHAVLSGCPHVSAGAKAQITQVRNGQNGLANHAADYGPKVAYITWKKAFNKYVKQPSTSKPASSTNDATQEDYDMSTFKTMTRSKDQTFEAKSQIVRLDDKGNVTFKFGPGNVTATFRFAISGLEPGGELQVQVYYVDTDKNGKTKKTGTFPVVGIPGTTGNTYGQVVFDRKIGAPAKGLTRRLRVRAGYYGSGKSVTVTSVNTTVRESK